MMTAYRRWACGLLAGVLVLLIAAGAVVWAADPCFYLRLPEGGKAVAFNERYQNAGLLRQAQADTVVLGTSMVANYRPENRVYRYNFFDKNCTTQARDIIEQAVDGEIRWPDNPPHSYRDLLHMFTAQDAWLRFGQDLLIGTEADQTLGTRGQDFLPLMLERDMAGAVIVDQAGKRRPAVTETRQWTPQAPKTGTGTWFTPRKAALAWFVLALGIAVAQVVRRRNWWWFDVPFIALQGVAGCLITFLFLASTHPGVDSNWLIAVLNPLPLLYLPWEIRRARRQPLQGKARHSSRFQRVCASGRKGECGPRIFHFGRSRLSGSRPFTLKSGKQTSCYGFRHKRRRSH